MSQRTSSSTAVGVLRIFGNKSRPAAQSRIFAIFAPGSFFAFQPNIGEMQKMHLVQILQQVITVEVAVAHTAVYVGDPRSLGRTDGGWE